MDESVIFVGEIQRRARRSVSVEESQCPSRNTRSKGVQISDQGSTVEYVVKHRLTTQFRKRARSARTQEKENLRPLTTVDLTRDSDEFVPTCLGQVSNTTTSMPSSNLLKDTNQDKSGPSLECSVCLESWANLEIRSLECGHLFCATCIETITKEKTIKCPKCRKVTKKRLIRPIYI